MQPSAARGLVLRLDEDTATLERAGGKGASLARMTAAGLPVPPGFILTTEAYRRFLDTNGLQAATDAILATHTEAIPESWDQIAAAIQAGFDRATVPDDVVEAALEAYATLTDAAADETPGSLGLPVAVRSSATAEDLPGASFAGQHETFLNVQQSTQLLDAIRACWASLWTARALAYRHRLGIDHRTVAMAVVVQRLVAGDVAGMTFTANPTTGARDELLVNASYGLGEAIVSGQVTPDTYTVDRATLAVTARQVGTKALAIEAAGGGGTTSRDVPTAQRDAPALTDAEVRDLAALALEVERLCDGVPQDIEWALLDGKFWLLQARPIAGLPASPLRDVRWEPPIPGSKWIRRQVVEHMPEPLSPLFEELYLQEGLERSMDTVMHTLRLAQGIDRLTGKPVAELMNAFVHRPFFATVNGYAYQRADIRLTGQAMLALVAATGRAIPTLFREAIPNWRDRELPRYLATVESWKACDPAAESAARLLQGVRELAWADARYWFAAALVIGTAKVTDGLLDGLLAAIAPGRNLSSGRFLQALSPRGLEADRELERIAAQIRSSNALRAVIATTAPEQLRAALGTSDEGRIVLQQLDTYFARFGHLIYSLDFAVPTQIDDPLPVLVTLRALVQRPGRDPQARFEELARERDAMTRATDRAFDPVRRRVFRTALRWARRYGPFREEALFYVGAGWPTLRRLALALGQRLAAAGILEHANDLFYLTSSEIEAASATRLEGQDGTRDRADTSAVQGAGQVAMTDQTDFARLARQRRELREARKRLTPPPAVPPAYQFKLGPLDLSSRESVRRNRADDTVLRGFAVSPGHATAPASVIRSPAEFGSMQPGTVLVCPTTTPAWTPLFSQARALVTDIGGVLAHGSIVAREYGIPAVMGTGIATTRIESGQQITVDGDAGTVSLSP